MKIILAITSALALSLSTSAAAATLITDGFGRLTGVTGLDVGGTLYDVNFVEGTCAGIFSGCNSTSDFAFNSLASAALAGGALLDQVFTPSNPIYDMPEATAGCDLFVANCFMLIPYATDGNSVAVVRVANSIFEPLDLLLTGQPSVTFDSSDFFDSVWAQISPSAAAVPEPGTWAMILMGFGAVGFAMRRRKQVERKFRQIA